MKSYKNGALYTDYGFLDSFNPSEDWIDGWWLGIDQGPILVMLENYRTQLIWKLMKKNAYIVHGLKGAGFTDGWLNCRHDLPPGNGARFRSQKISGPMGPDIFNGIPPTSAGTGSERLRYAA